MQKNLSVCYFGIYKKNYTRNKILIDGLKLNGVEVIECNTRKSGFGKYFYLLRNFWKIRKRCNVIIVGFPGHTVMPLAWMLAKLTRKKIIFDAFVSLYDSIILDRESHSKVSYHAIKFWALDWVSCCLADKILLDADEHIKYFQSAYHIKKDKFRRILVGCDDSILYPRNVRRDDKNFIVHFHGTYIPVQGIPYIVEAAKILENENIIFRLVGRLTTYGQAIEMSKKLGLKKIEFRDYMPYEQLAENMAQADVCLGMFGNRDRAKRTGAFKVVEGMAMRKPIITADTPAMREILVDRVHCLFCKIANSRDLAEKILLLKNHPELSEKIAHQGYELYKEKLTPSALGRDLISVIREVQ